MLAPFDTDPVVPKTGPVPLYTDPGSLPCCMCPLAEGRTLIVNGAGPYKPRLMVIGEAPGEAEDRSGNPFVGQSGKLLRGTLSELGCPPEHVWFTNAAKCRPPGNRNPTALELATCRPWLEIEVESIQPQAILCVGKVPEEQLAQMLPEVLDGIPIYTAYHPAYILRKRRKTPEWREQLQCALGILPLPKVAPMYRRGPINWGAPWLAVDTETDDADADDEQNSSGQRMVCFQVSDGINAQMFMPDATEELEVIRSRRVAVQGAKFDLPLLGIDPWNLDAWEDTQLMAYVLREDQIGLKPQALKHHGLYIPPISTIIGTGKKRVPFSEALATNFSNAVDYATKDAYGTALLAESQYRRLQADPKLLAYYEDIEKPTLATIMDMEAAGVEIDPGALVPMDKALTAEINGLADSLHIRLGPVLLSSPEQLADALISYGFGLHRKTPKSGKFQLDKDTLLELAGVASKDELETGDLTTEQELLRDILRWRESTKLRSTYVVALPKLMDAANRIHGRFNQCVTNTNRLSSSKPNLQNQPLRGRVAKAVRRVFKARDGCVLVKADYSQLELRIYAHYTRSPLFLDAYLHTVHDTLGRDGECLRCDVHQSVAVELLIPRWRAKNVVFAANYGANDAKLATTAGVPREQAAAFHTRMLDRVPSLSTWPKSCTARLATTGYLETLLGWRGYFPEYWSPVPSERRKAQREACNFPIQGTASGVVKRLMILAQQSLVKYTQGAALVLQVHDEVVYEVPVSEARSFAADLESLGAATGELCGLTVPLRLDVQIGLNWADVVPWSTWLPEAA